MNVKLVVVKVDVGKQFTNEPEFGVHDHMLQWNRTKDAKLRFNMVIRRLDNSFDKYMHLWH